MFPLPRASRHNGLDPVASHAKWLQRRALVRKAWTVRVVAYAILAGGVAWLAVAEAAVLAEATLVMACGAAVATAGAFWVGRKEAAEPGRARAMPFLVAGYALKLAALPLLALGGGWLAWQIGPGLDVAIGVAGLGICAYAYGTVARMDGLARLPDSNGGIP